MITGRKAKTSADAGMWVEVLVGVCGNCFLIASPFFSGKWKARLSAEGNGGRRGMGNLREYKMAAYMIKRVYGLEICGMNGQAT